MSYRIPVIFGTEERLDSVMRANIPTELSIEGVGSRYPRTIKRGNVDVGRYSIDQAFPYSGAVELRPDFQKVTGYNPEEILDKIASVF